MSDRAYDLCGLGHAKSLRTCVLNKAHGTTDHAAEGQHWPHSEAVIVVDVQHLEDTPHSIDINNSACGDPYIDGTPYLRNRADAEALVKTLIPLVDEAAKAAIILRAVEELPHSREAEAKGWQTHGVWSTFAKQGIALGDLPALVLLLREGGNGDDVENDWRTYCTITSQARNHAWQGGPEAAITPDDAVDHGDSPTYEEMFSG